MSEIKRMYKKREKATRKNLVQSCSCLFSRLMKFIIGILHRRFYVYWFTVFQCEHFAARRYNNFSRTKYSKSFSLNFNGKRSRSFLSNEVSEEAGSYKQSQIFRSFASVEIFDFRCLKILQKRFFFFNLFSFNTYLTSKTKRKANVSSVGEEVTLYSRNDDRDKHAIAFSSLTMCTEDLPAMARFESRIDLSSSCAFINSEH